MGITIAAVPLWHMLMHVHSRTCRLHDIAYRYLHASDVLSKGMLARNIAFYVKNDVPAQKLLYGSQRPALTLTD